MTESRSTAAAAALAAVARRHGIPIRADEVALLCGLPQVAEIGDLVIAAHLLGFNSVPLAGEYDDLAELVLPAIVVMHAGPAVLHAVDAETASIELWPETEACLLARAAFCAQWTGDCVQLAPDADRLARTGEALALRRSRWRRVVQVLRFAPPRAPKLGFLAAAAGLPALVLFVATDASPSATAGTLAVALAAVSSLWLALFGATCPRCAAAHQQVGALPLDRAGVVAYAALFGAQLAAPANPWPAHALLAASGAHLYLVGLLVRARTMCVACVLTAVSVFTATALLIPGVSVEAMSVGPLFALGFGGMAMAVPRMRRAVEHASVGEAIRLAKSALTRTPGDGRVHVIVWKRAGCLACVLYEVVHRPGLLEAFGDAIVIEEHDAGAASVPAPLILITGPAPVLFMGLPSADDAHAVLHRAVEQALDPAAHPVPPGGLVLVSPDPPR